MFTYYGSVAWTSLKREKGVTFLAILAVALGIGTFMTALTLYRAMASDPIPETAHELFAPQIDNWGPVGDANAGVSTPDHIPDRLTYRDAQSLTGAHIAAQTAEMFETETTVTPLDPQEYPFDAHVRATSTDFFSMFGVPFEYGGPWAAAADTNRAHVAVITSALNERLFAGTDSVGKTLHLGNSRVAAYRIVGVMEPWQPIPRFYDLSSNKFSGSDQLFIPFSTALANSFPVGVACGPVGFGPGTDPLTQSECIWVHLWVRLATPSVVSRYRQFLMSYAAQQKQLGRFNWRPRTALRDVPNWLSYEGVVPKSVQILDAVSFAFLLVCLLNATTLLLAKSAVTAMQLGIRRALGASRRSIFGQTLLEAALIGVIGGGLGLLLAQGGLLAGRLLLPRSYSSLSSFRPGDAAIALLVTLFAIIAVGVYPAWRASHPSPGAALRRRGSLGRAMIGAQIAVTFAILTNAVFIVHKHVSLISRPSGVDESNLFVMKNEWVTLGPDLGARTATDLLALRRLSDVADAYATNAYPFAAADWGFRFTLDPGRGSTVPGSIYFSDAHTLNTLGLNLVAGRDFLATEVESGKSIFSGGPMSGIIITRELARKLAPTSSVLGRIVTITPSPAKAPITAPIIGIVDRLQQPRVPDTEDYQSALVPFQFGAPSYYYLVRVKPGRLYAAMSEARSALFRLRRDRVVSAVETLTQAREAAYWGDRSIAGMLSAVCALVLAVTAFGILGLTNYWVAARRSEIGIRRTLGATRKSILRQVQVENALTVAWGSTIGILLSIGGSYWLVSRVASDRLPWGYLVIGAIGVLGVGQIATLFPALRAASVPPAEAART